MTLLLKYKTLLIRRLISRVIIFFIKANLNLFAGREFKLSTLTFELAKFTSSAHGNPQLVDSSGFVYNKHKSNERRDRIFWICARKTRYKCTARATTEGDYIIKYLGEHIHPPDTLNNSFL